MLNIIRTFLTTKAAEMMVNALITSRLDGLNSLLHDLPENLLNNLQVVQNNAARLIFKEKKYSHVTHLLKSLHWLPVTYRIKYKINLITFKVMHGLGPKYLEEMFVPYRPSRTLRSSSMAKLQTKVVKTNWGKRSFSYAAPHLCNKLPKDLRDITDLTCF